MGFSEDTRWFFRSALEWHSEMESCNPGDTSRGTVRGTSRRTNGNQTDRHDDDEENSNKVSASCVSSLDLHVNPASALI